MSRRRSCLVIHKRAYYYTCSGFKVDIISGTGSPYTTNLTQILLPGSFYESGYASIPNTLDDGNVPIPMGNMTFNFYGTNYSNAIYWSSNNAILFGTISNQNINLEANLPRNLIPSILLGNYDRILKTFYYSNFSASNYSITTILVTFYNYFTDTISSPTYQYKIRFIKENTGSQNQFIEVYIISSPPSPGYSSTLTSYPSGFDVNGKPIDSAGNIIDSTKLSPYNITNGTSFLNPCGATFSLSSPATNTSFVFSSDSTGTNWTFTNNSYVNV